MGLSIIEALDTLYLMELDGEVDRCLGWIEDRLDFDVDADFHVFETTIRLVGACSRAISQPATGVCWSAAPI
ncbi:hypothetical protein GCM10020000_73530 [Streptomyces olivoverticillatus]